MNPVSVEAFAENSQGEISECDSCCVNSGCESGTWSRAHVSNDIYVLPAFAVEVVEVGELSDSGWEFGSECSVAVSGVVVVSDVGETAPSVVTVRCRSRAPMEGGGPWSAQERMAIARMDQYVNNSD